MADAARLLGKATTRIVYDLIAYQRTKRDRADRSRPVCRHAGARDARRAIRGRARRPRSSISFSYSDGFGREIQKKIQAEPAQPPVGDRPGAW